jgi:hypothetical protein
MNNFNKTIATKATLLVSTMGCVYLFTAWALLPLIFPGIRDVVFYVSSSLLQLSLLPLIMVGQKLLGLHAEERAEQDHNALMESVEELRRLIESDRQLKQEEDEEIVDLHEINERLIRIEGHVKPARRSPKKPATRRAA